MPTFDVSQDRELRESAFAYLRSLILRSGGLVHRYELLGGFSFRGERFPLRHPQMGIHKPKVLEAALSISTAYAADPSSRPYDDHPGPDGFMRYKWDGSDPQRYTNRALRLSCERQLPLVWFQGVAPSTYLPIFPVYLVAEELDEMQFVVALDEGQRMRWKESEIIDLSIHRQYADVVAKKRLHQPVFRARVITAYESRCGICTLRYPELLDAAHIKADSDGGEPVVTNGISMCKIHHAAYDSNLLGIDADYQIKIRPDVLDDSDGPTLRHAIQGLHGSPLHVPGQRAAKPDRDLLAERFEVFLKAS